MCYASVEQAMSLIPVEPSPSPVLNTLDFISDENLVERETLNGGSSFGGYPSLLDRDLSYDIRDSMRVHCGYVALLISSVFICFISFITPILKRVILFFTPFRFVKGRRPGQGTGFDIDESDLSAMENCFGVVVASAIFGNILLHLMWN